MKKIIIIAIFISFVFVNKGYSQLPGHWSAQYEMSFASGEMGSFIEDASFRGLAIQYRASLNANLLVGLDVAWNAFDEKKDRDTYTVGNVSLNGVQFRYQSQVPILVSADYIFSEGAPLRTYVGLGVGTVYSERLTNMNLYQLYESTWQFAMKPEIGLLYEVSYNVSLKIAGKYYNGFKTETLDNQGYFSISTGLAFTL